MAQDAELKLKVSLDLAFFRQQLNTVGAQLGGQSLQLNIQFNKKSIADQYRLLDTYLGRKTFKVKIESNTLDTLVDKVSTFKKNLIALGNEKIDLAVNVTSNIDETRKSIKEKLASVDVKTQLADPVNVDDFIRGVAKKVDDQVKKSYAAGGVPIATKLALPGIADPLKALQKNLNQKDPLRAKISTTPSILKADVTAFKTAVSEKFKDITVKVKAELGSVSKQSFATGQAGAAGLFEYMRSQGLSGGNMPQATEVGRSERLKKALEDLTVKQLQVLAKEQGIGGVSKLKKDPLIAKLVTELNQDIAENILGNIKNQLRDAGKIPLKGVLDTFARGLFNMLGMDPASMRQQMAQQIAQQRVLPGVNFPATVPSRAISIGPSSTGRSLPAGRAAAGMIGAAQSPIGLLPSMSGRSQTQAIVEALIAQQGPKMLPSGGGALVDTKRIYAELQKNLDNALRRMFTVLEVSVSETGAGLKDGLNTFAYLAQALKDAEARTKQSRIAEEVDSLINRIETALRLAAARVNVRQVQIGIGASMQSALPAARVAGLLPAGVGREPSRYATGGESREQMMARRTAEAYARSGLRGLGVMSERQAALPGTTFMGDAFVSGGGRDRVTGSGQPPERGGALAFPGGAMGRATQLPSSYMALGNLSAELKKSQEFFNKNKIPLAGAIEELAGEFGNATKQVLLYGTAYKALAFFMDLPNQALNAAKSLQTFNNQLNAITGSSENADRAFTFVDNLAARFNVPLESARQGFVKLYASMAPAGFSSGEIENLFTGISKASATLGLSSDKVDRITYAFSQMASKGQLMSEEVSGQLGDVIPGALSIMAEAARMDIATFKKAMEDGVFVGETFKQVMSNVPIVLENRFGKGAANAAKTLQGSMNALAISTQKFYESFEPIVSMGAASIFPIIATAINDATQAVQAFTAAMQGNTTPAQMLEGNAAQIYGVLQQLREIFAAVVSVIQGVTPTVMILGKVFLTTAEYIAKFINTPIGGFLADIAIKAGIALVAIQLFAKTGIAALASQMLLLYRNTTAAGGGLLNFAGALGKATVASKLFKLAVTGLIGAGILFGIEALISAIGRMANRLSDARKNAIAARDAIKSMSGAELGEQTIVQQNKLQALSRTQKAGGKITSERDRKILEQMGMRTYATGGKFIGGQLIGGQYGVDKNLIESFRIREQEQLKAIQDQRKSLYDTTPLPLNEVELGAGKGSDKELNRAAEDARKFADDKRKYEADLMKISSQQAINLNEMEFDHWKNLQQSKYDFLEAGQNEWMSRELKFQRDLQAIEIRRIEAIRKARIETVKAETDAQASAYVAGDSGGGGGAAMFGATGRVFNAPGWVHGHFQNMNREALVQDTVEVVMKLLQQGVKPELGSGQKFTAGMQQTQVEQLVRRGIASHKSYASGVGAIDVFVPQGTQVPVGLSGVSNLGGAAGVSGNLPRGTQLMHLDSRSRSGAANATTAGAPASRIRAEAKKDYASALASQEAINAKEKESLATKYANVQAQQELNVLIREYTASIVPVEQQKLENTLLQNRIDLISSGALGEALDTEQKISEAREKAALGAQMANAQIEKNNKLVEDGIIKQEEADKLNASQVEKIKQLTQGLEAYIPLLRERLSLEQSGAEATLRGEIARATPLGGMGLSAGFIGPAGERFEEAIGRRASMEDASRFAELQNQLTLLETRNEAVKQSIYSIGDAFGEAMTTGVANLVSGTATAKEVFASFLQSVGQALSQAAAKMIATYIAIGIAKIFAGLGSASTSATGPNPGGIPSTGNVTAPSVNGFDAGSIANVAANGAVWKGGFTPFTAFANGGVVNGPTLGLIGEGKYNEAVVPLPDGRSIPVSFGGRSARDMMGNGAPGMPQAPSLSMQFETTKINGVEYVSREQLEQAMAETRRASIAGGAKQGMSMTLDKIKQSPSTRSRIGMR